MDIVEDIKNGCFVNKNAIPMDLGIPVLDLSNDNPQILKFPNKEKRKLENLCKRLFYWRIPRKAKKHIKKLLSTKTNKKQKDIRIKEYFEALLKQTR